MADTKTLQEADFQQFSKSDSWYRHPLANKILDLDAVAEKGSTCWLLDMLIIAQVIPDVAAVAFQFWVLTVRRDRTATLACGDGDGKIVFSLKIAFTNFPLRWIKFYFANNTLLLPNKG